MSKLILLCIFIMVEEGKKKAMGMTINKSQDQTFDKITLYLPKSVFSHGQLYVAFLRVSNGCAGLIIFISDGPKITTNVVYTQVFH
uniref:Uncharacterized protein n=1 Tax=Lepeophtheirus salmonis TaxID=72036 RepID=A0A0K2UGT4_LEPSM